MKVCGRFEVGQQTKRRWLQKGAGWSFAASRAAAPRGHQPLQQHAGARPRAPRGTPMPLPRLRLTRESPLEEDSLRLLGKACALLPQFTLCEFCAVKPPPAPRLSRKISLRAFRWYVGRYISLRGSVLTSGRSWLRNLYSG